MGIRELNKNETVLSWFEKGFTCESNYLKINYFTHALEEAPDYKEALYQRGLAYHELKRFEKVSLHPNETKTVIFELNK